MEVGTCGGSAAGQNEYCENATKEARVQRLRLHHEKPRRPVQALGGEALDGLVSTVPILPFLVNRWRESPAARGARPRAAEEVQLQAVRLHWQEFHREEREKSRATRERRAPARRERRRRRC